LNATAWKPSATPGKEPAINSQIRLDRPGAGEIAPSAPYSLTEKIDVCRGVFAFLVVASHAWLMAEVFDPNWGGGLPAPIRGVVGSVAGAGLHYVMGFFVLSGYCIQASVQRLAAGGGRFPLKAYLVARLTRVLPLYYLALAFVVAVEIAIAPHRPDYWKFGIDSGTFLQQLFLTQGFTQTLGAFAASWSITNEVVYYVVFGLVAAVFGATRSRPATVGLALTVGAGLALQAIDRAGFHHPVVPKAALLFGLGSIWFLGALTAVHADRLPGVPGLPTLARLWPLALATSMAMWYDGRVQQRNVYLTSGLAFTLMLIHFSIQERAGGRSASRAPRPYTAFLGLVSYPVYLFHGPVLLAFGAVVEWSGAAAPLWLLYPAGTVIGIGCCLPLGRLAERPLLAWRAGVLKRLRTAPTPAREPAPTAVPALGVTH
jgi:peptidoglycan/LPS O-acetylase OafA/YrhL